MLSGAKHLAYEAGITLETKNSSLCLSEVPRFVRDDVKKTQDQMKATNGNPTGVLLFLSLWALPWDSLRAAEVIPAIMLRFARDYLRNRAEIPE
jgi:hypothetical protein